MASHVQGDVGTGCATAGVARREVDDVDQVVPHAAEACNYLLAVDVDMNTVDGYEMSSWSSGYGDFVMKPDFSTMRRVPWQPGTAIILADLLEVPDRGRGRERWWQARRQDVRFPLRSTMDADMRAA
mgnify:CR=1 FL=1